ncbi:hypothetical protein BH09CHL1_BH09CHL1_13030 [soil metagenome]
MGIEISDTIERAQFTRRLTLQAATLAIAPVAVMQLKGTDALAAKQDSATPVAAIPVSGEEIPELTALNQVMLDTVTAWSIPGAQLAVSKDGKLAFSRGYGYADVDAGEGVQLNSLFRIASVSKTITTVAILKLVEDGSLSLSDKAFELLALDPPANAVVDPRVFDITIEHLLVHAGGWDGGASGDVQYLPLSAMPALVFDQLQPSTAQLLVQYNLATALDFDPGSQSVYSNFGFNVLGRVIEKISGQTYEAFTKERVLDPSGASAMAIGHTRLAERLPNEVIYYGPERQLPRPSVFPGEGFVPVGYGSFFVESLDAHGGWIASAEDLIKFATAIDGQRGEALLTPETIAIMETTPRPSAEAGEAGAGNSGAPRFGLGWVVTEVDGGYEWAHAGALEGSNASWLFRAADGVTIATIFNTLPEDYGTFFGGLQNDLRAAIAGVTTWPDQDLFG